MLGQSGDNLPHVEMEDERSLSPQPGPSGLTSRSKSGRKFFRESFHTMTTIEDDSDPRSDSDSESSHDVPDSSTSTKNSRPKKLKKASELLDESSQKDSTDDEVLADMVIALQVKLHSARSDLVFVQGKQKMLLRNLHCEMEKLQKTVQELQFAVVTKGLSYIDEETYKARVAELEKTIAAVTMRCNYLNAQLTVANNSLVDLNERIQIQEFQHDDIIRQRDEIIAVLKRQLEMKSIEVEVLRQMSSSVSPIDETHPPLKRRIQTSAGVSPMLDIVPHLNLVLPNISDGRFYGCQA